MQRDDKTMFVGYRLDAGRSAKETLMLQGRHQQPIRHMVSWLASAVMVALTLLAGCGSPAEVALEPTLDVPPPTPTDFPPPPTATPVPATAVPTPTVEIAPTIEPTPTLLPEGAVPPAMAEEAEILEVHRRFMTELFARDERNPEDVKEFLMQVDSLTRGDARERLLVGLEGRERDGTAFVGQGYLSSVSEIGWGVDGRVQVFDCSLDTGELWGTTGLQVEAADDFELRSTVLSRRSVDGWKVELLNPGSEPCVPS